ncbi:hypothetical protein MTO96_024504 [Rhipicephalus appendiculatus]
MEAFLEMVRSYPCLYDKSNVDFKGKELRANRWHIIGQQFAMTGEQAAAKFKNFRDRWLKISMEKRKARKSGAPGKDGKGKSEWAYYEIVDSILRTTPYYAENKKRKNDQFEEAVQEVLENCSSTLSKIQKAKEIAAPSDPNPPDECQQAANWMGIKLRKLPPRKRAEVLFKIHSLIFEAEMESLDLSLD